MLASYILLNKWNQDVTLEGRACFDFLKAEDKGDSESWKHRSHAHGLPCKDTALGPNHLPLSAQHLSQLPHKQPTLRLVSLAAHTEYLLSNTEAKISCQKGHPGPEWPGKRGWVFLMCVHVCIQDTLSHLCEQTGAINWKFPEFPAAGGESWYQTNPKSAAIARHMGSEWRPDLRYWAKNVLCLFSSVCRACAVLSRHLNAESR